MLYDTIRWVRLAREGVFSNRDATAQAYFVRELYMYGRRPPRDPFITEGSLAA